MIARILSVVMVLAALTLGAAMTGGGDGPLPEKPKECCNSECCTPECCFGPF